MSTPRRQSPRPNRSAAPEQRRHCDVGDTAGSHRGRHRGADHCLQHTQMASKDDWSEAGWIRWNRQFNEREWAEWAAKGSKWSAREWEIYARDVPEDKWAKWQIKGYDRARKSRSVQGPASGSSGSEGGSASASGH